MIKSDVISLLFFLLSNGISTSSVKAKKGDAKDMFEFIKTEYKS